MSLCLSRALPSFPFASDGEISQASVLSPSCTSGKPGEVLLLLDAPI